MFGCDKMKISFRADFCLIVGILLAAGLAAFLMYAPYGRKAAAAVVIEQDGREVMRLPLSEDRTVRIESESGYNAIHITGRGAEVTETDCPDQICQKQGEITALGESIICLPHRLVIRLTGDLPAGPDAVTN